MSIGGHDLDKVDFPVKFEVTAKQAEFYPISAPIKKVISGDFLYCDQKGIMAYLGCRDGEAYKMTDQTKSAVFIIQGNVNTSVEYRKAALQ